MSRHEGVSCDSCLKGNFGGKRYKCLICYDYDLCASCYDAGVASTTRHSVDHPMQCILTRSEFDLYFGGESISSEQHQSYTCPHCGRMGFTDLLLLEHVSNEHSDATSEVVCPVCAAYPGGEPNHVIDDLAAHLMLEHRTSTNELDVQLSGMRAVRRIPHHGRSVANPRTRRASNMQYQTPGSTLMVLSPGDRDRDAMDPIAELLSQLSSVRSRTAAAQSVSSQLQQLEMQLHSSRPSASSRLQADRLMTSQPTPLAGVVPDPLGRSITTITLPSSASTIEHQATAVSSSYSASSTSSRDRSAFLLTRLCDTKKSETEQQAVELDRADRSMFVQELLLALLSQGSDCKALMTPEPVVALSGCQASDSKPCTPEVESTSDSSGTVSSAAQSVQQQEQNCATETTVLPDQPSAIAAVPQVEVGRSNLHTPSNALSSDSRILAPSAASLGSRPVTKRKSVPANGTNKTGKDATAMAATTGPKKH